MLMDVSCLLKFNTTCFVRLKDWSLLQIAYAHYQDQLLQNLSKANLSKSHILLLRKQITDTVVTWIALCGNVQRYVPILLLVLIKINACMISFRKITEAPNFYALSKCSTPCSAGKKPINVRHAQSLQLKHCQVYKKEYSRVLPILVFQLLR